MLTPASASDRRLLAGLLAADGSRWVGPSAQLAMPDEVFSPGMYRTTFSLAGAGFLRLEVAEGLGVIVVWVAPPHRRRGLASAALVELVEHAEELRLLALEAVVDPENHAALAFFGANSFAHAAYAGDAHVLQRCVGELAPWPSHPTG